VHVPSPNPSPATDGAQPQVGVRSVDRALSILEQLAAAGRECSLSELSSSAGLSVGTTHRVVRTLLDRGYVRQLATKAYVLGPHLVELGDRARYGTGIGVDTHLRELAERAGGTAGLAVLDGPGIVFVAQAAPRHRGLRMRIELGEEAPIASAIGDAILASLSPRPRSTRSLPEYLCRRHDPDLAARLEQVRRRGYAVDHGQVSDGVNCVAASIAHSVVPAAVALLRISGSASDPGANGVAELLKGVAYALSVDLGRLG
jgi:IclR family acetate operon transcriptional repressor